MEIIIVSSVVIFIIWLLFPSSNSSQKIKTKRTSGTSKSEVELTEEFKEILDILNNSNESIFITGKAGTGKSTLINHFITNTRKKLVILAPTGIAALNVNGQTINSFFKFPPTIINPEHIKPDYLRAGLFINLEMIIIDEVSMTRVDLMDGIDVALRRNRNKLDEPFGGIQMVFVGDLFQLPPVVTSEDRVKIVSKYGGEYFFDAPVFKTYKYHFKELNKIFRQSAEQIQFKNLLNNVRNNSVKFEDMVLINSRHKDNTTVQEDGIFLTSKKDIARRINAEKLESIQLPLYEFVGTLSGKYLKLAEQTEEQLYDKLPSPFRLKLKHGVHVVMLKNDSGRRWANGSVGEVVKISKDSLWVSINGNQYKVERETWKEVEYILNPETKEIEARTIAEYTQYPLQLAFAMTIHKSQGKTFDKIVVDIGTGAFAHGQVYVALSRCRTLEGISLNNPINDKDIIVDPRVVSFYSTRTIPVLPLQVSNSTTLDILLKAIKDNAIALIEYQNYDGEVSKRQISKIQISNNHKDRGYLNAHIKAYCHLRKEEREFKIDRIRKITIK